MVDSDFRDDVTGVAGAKLAVADLYGTRFCRAHVCCSRVRWRADEISSTANQRIVTERNKERLCREPRKSCSRFNTFDA
jgi:hypothetical protein